MSNAAENDSNGNSAEENSATVLENRRYDVWSESRFGDMISLRGILDIVDLTPSAKSKIYADFE